MHSGFMTLRNTFHTNFIAKYTGNIPVAEDAKREIKRILTIWDNARRVTKERVARDQDEGFLFGKFSIADAWFWPVLWVGNFPFFFYDFLFITLFMGCKVANRGYSAFVHITFPSTT
jgi:glutathione S-transferase